MALVEWLDKQVYKHIEKDMKKRVKKSLRVVADSARRDCPKDKGDLKNSIKEVYFSRARSPMGIVKATGSEKDGYAGHVDLGYWKPDKHKKTRYMPPQPFLRNSIKRPRSKLRKILGI